MAQINLLPWREQERRVKKLRFIMLLASMIGLALLLVFILHLFVNSLIGYQQDSNNFLQTELAQEQAELTKLNKKKQEQNIVESQLNFIFSLRNNSYKTINMFNELINIVPEGILLIKMTRDGKNIIIIGKSESNLQVTKFLENIAKSSTFKQPVLNEISQKENLINSKNYFQLKFELRE